MMFEDMLARFGRERYGRAQWEAGGRATDGYMQDMWQEMADMGWFSAALPDPESGCPFADLVPLFIAAGEFLWREPLLAVLGESAGVLLAASEAGAAVDGLLEGVAAGTARPAFAHREAGSGWSDTPLGTIAASGAGQYALTGEKSLVVAAETSTQFIVTAQIDASAEAGLFLVERDAAGVCVEPFRMVDDRGVARVAFSGAPGRWLASCAQVLPAVQRRGRILAAAEAVGIMRATTRTTAAHLQERRQFGRALGSFQVLQHRLVEMYLLYRESYAMVSALAHTRDDDAPSLDRQTLMLRAHVARAGCFVTQQAIQMHGGMGMTAELPVGDAYKRMLALESLYGSAEWALERLAA